MVLQSIWVNCLTIVLMMQTLCFLPPGLSTEQAFKFEVTHARLHSRISN